MRQVTEVSGMALRPRADKASCNHHNMEFAFVFQVWPEGNINPPVVAVPRRTARNQSRTASMAGPA